MTDRGLPAPRGVRAGPDQPTSVRPLAAPRHRPRGSAARPASHPLAGSSPAGLRRGRCHAARRLGPRLRGEPRFCRATRRARCWAGPPRPSSSRSSSSRWASTGLPIERYFDWLGGAASPATSGTRPPATRRAPRRPIWDQITRQVVELAGARRDRDRDHDSAVAPARRDRWRRARAARPRPRDLDRLARADLAAGVRDRCAPHPRLLQLARRAARRSR